MKKLAILSTSLAAVIALGVMVGCTPAEEPGGEEPQAYYMPNWSGKENEESSVSVHDPSIFKDPVSGTYYVFGTHYAVASSTDLINWTQVASDNQYQVLYGNGTAEGYSAWPAALKSTLDLVQPASTNNTTWAPDVEYYDGTYYMYYSLTKDFGTCTSAIGRVESNNVLGPYGGNTIIIESVTQTGPNCIDPELFYDKDGRLWMVYGSAFGGLYIKELYNEGENWGLPIEEEGFGKLLWSGSKNQEGPFIFYNEETDYYYMMVSYGSLMTTYNMRVARSKNPDGPYVDITGQDVATATGDNGGNKIAGNYTLGTADGMAAIGHNSVIKEDGKYFVVAHARRRDGDGNAVTAGHSVYVFQLYFNEDGWPVMNPNRYANETIGTGVTADKIAGEYNLVVHTSGTTQTFAEYQTYNFTTDGNITLDGANVGSWELSGAYYIHVTLDGVTYKGVVTPSYTMYERDVYSNYGTFSITATSDAGIPLWAVGQFVGARN